MGKDPKIKGQATARPVATAAPAPAKPTLTIENAANWTPGEISRAMDVEPSQSEYERIVQIVRQTKKDKAMFDAADSRTTAKESARLRIMEAIDELTSMMNKKKPTQLAEEATNLIPKSNESALPDSWKVKKSGNDGYLEAEKALSGGYKVEFFTVAMSTPPQIRITAKNPKTPYKSQPLGVINAPLDANGKLDVRAVAETASNRGESFIAMIKDFKTALEEAKQEAKDLAKERKNSPGSATAEFDARQSAITRKKQNAELGLKRMNFANIPMSNL